MDINFTDNPKQAEFIELALNAAEGNNEFRYLCYGGSIRGGKTFAVLGLLIIFCRMYPGSKWIVYRQDFPSLQDTTIPSLEKILAGSSSWTWHRDRSNFHVDYKNGSKIFFQGQNIEQDPELNAMLGLECNGIVLEQAEELSQKLFQMAQSRLGSWIIPRMPKPLIMLTVNPSQNWVKETFYIPWQKGELKEPFHFTQALPSDNPHVTEDQREAWGRMHDRYKKQFIEGDWSNLEDKNSLWAFSFDRKKHIPQFLDPAVWAGNHNEKLYLSFDFNRNPITCSVIQHYNQTIHVLEQIKLENSDIYQMCAYIKRHWPDHLLMVCGDASGKNSTALVKDALNFYKVIQQEFRLTNLQFKIPGANPPLNENQVLVNSILSNYNVLLHPEKAKTLIFDFENVRMNPDGTIVKRDRTDPTQQADALDAFRYYCNAFHRNFISQKQTV